MSQSKTAPMAEQITTNQFDAAANLLGLPGGTAIGVAFGWRLTFLAVAALAVVAAIGISAPLTRFPRERYATCARQVVKAAKEIGTILSARALR